LADRTHPISLAIVRDLAAGLGPEPLHTLAQEILDARAGGPTAASVASVAAIGHQSGRDLLAGFLAGLCVLRSGVSNGFLPSAVPQPTTDYSQLTTHSHPRGACHA